MSAAIYVAVAHDLAAHLDTAAGATAVATPGNEVIVNRDADPETPSFKQYGTKAEALMISEGPEGLGFSWERFSDDGAVEARREGEVVVDGRPVWARDYNTDPAVAETVREALLQVVERFVADDSDGLAEVDNLDYRPDSYPL